MFLVQRIEEFVIVFSHRPHPHKVYSASQSVNRKKVSNGGVVTIKETITGSKVIQFKDIGIIFVKKAQVRASLEERKSRNVNPYGSECNFSIQIQAMLNFRRNISQLTHVLQYFCCFVLLEQSKIGATWILQMKLIFTRFVFVFK